VDGALIHAGALVNGTSIVRESDMPEVFTPVYLEMVSWTSAVTSPELVRSQLAVARLLSMERSTVA
jgi:hypothetical protein